MFDDMFLPPSLQSQHQLLHPHPLPLSPPDLNPKVSCTLVCRMKQAFMASVASGQQEVLPPISPQQQPQHLRATCSSFYFSWRLILNWTSVCSQFTHLANTMTDQQRCDSTFNKYLYFFSFYVPFYFYLIYLWYIWFFTNKININKQCVCLYCLYCQMVGQRLGLLTPS